MPTFWNRGKTSIKYETVSVKFPLLSFLLLFIYKRNKLHQHTSFLMLAQNIDFFLAISVYLMSIIWNYSNRVAGARFTWNSFNTCIPPDEAFSVYSQLTTLVHCRKCKKTSENKAAKSSKSQQQKQRQIRVLWMLPSFTIASHVLYLNLVSHFWFDFFSISWGWSNNPVTSA